MMLLLLGSLGLMLACLVGLLFVPFLPNNSPRGDLYELGEAIRKLVQAIKESIHAD
jgi:hypothetical protein